MVETRFPKRRARHITEDSPRFCAAIHDQLTDCVNCGQLALNSRSRRVRAHETGIITHCMSPTMTPHRVMTAESTAPAPVRSSSNPDAGGHGSAEPRLVDRALAKMLPVVPRRLVRRFSAPYIAGDTLVDAIVTVRALQAGGLATTLDVLGEAITTLDEARATRDAYLDAIDELAKLGATDLVNVSVKLTALGLGIDDDVCVALVREIADRAAQHGGFVRIDMEDSPYTDATLAVFDALTELGCTNLGVVIQAYLHRSEQDVAALAARGVRVRLVKGIYLEPESIAWRDMHRINENFIRLGAMLLDAGCHVAFATHDDALIAAAEQLVTERKTGPDRYEFQMLLGVREDRRDELAAAGHCVRVYVPFGARWYEYSIRRLRENPRVAGMVARDTLSSLIPGRRRHTR